jgi:hypothetical protein
VRSTVDLLRINNLDLDTAGVPPQLAAIRNLAELQKAAMVLESLVGMTSKQTSEHAAISPERTHQVRM